MTPGGGRSTVLRVAIADRMVAKVCVDCHNSHPQTPKNDWKIGDVRGVLELITPIDAQLGANQSMMLYAGLIILVVGTMAILLIAFVLRRNVVKPISEGLTQIGLASEQITRSSS